MVTLTPYFGSNAILPSRKAKSSDTISALSTQAARFTSGTFAYDRPKPSGFDTPSARPAWMKTSHSRPKNLLSGKGAADFPRNKLHTSQTTDCMMTDYRLALSTVASNSNSPTKIPSNSCTFPSFLYSNHTSCL